MNLQRCPCILCGATNYALSMGGPTICPSCDCGNPPTDHKLWNELHKAKEYINKLENAIREHRDQKGDDRCWLDDRDLYAVLPEGNKDISSLPPAEEFLGNCKRFHASRQPGGQEYISSQRRIDELEKRIKEMAQDWSEDHTHVQEVAKRLGVPANKVEGDSYGVPSIIDLLGMIEEQFKTKL